ncbi:MAG: anthranilate phosphoribosyltransferase [Gammaproteobacteria bacterium]|nr:anthranilate phosphoribosyltransferase [Gammaproteobacteria bacterium]
MSSIDNANEVAMRKVIQRIATGPELSKDLSVEQAEEAMQLVLNQQADPVQAAIFLIALRMKRETDDENIGVLQAIRQSTRRCVVETDEVVDLFDPYNGYIRSAPMSPFIPAVLAACGLACFSHGVERAGPKYGVTHEEILIAAGVDVAMSPEGAALNLAKADMGWAYLSQTQFCPQLADLSALRHKMVKRSVLTTVEGLAGALVGRKQTHLVTGYVHKAYPPIYLGLAKAVGYDSAMALRGVEGGVVPTLRQPAKVHQLLAGQSTQFEMTPSDFGIQQEQRAVSLPSQFDGVEGVDMSVEQRQDLAHSVLEIGLQALSGEQGVARGALVYGAALILWHCQKATDYKDAADQVTKAIDSGTALSHFSALQHG